MVAIPNLIPIVSLIGLLLVIYSVLGEFLFSKVMLPNKAIFDHKHVGLDIHANFQNFGRSLLTLMRMVTGEAWNEIMWSCTRPRSILYQCEMAE